MDEAGPACESTTTPLHGPHTGTRTTAVDPMAAESDPGRCPAKGLTINQGEEQNKGFRQGNGTSPAWTADVPPLVTSEVAHRGLGGPAKLLGTTAGSRSTRLKSLSFSHDWTRVAARHAAWPTYTRPHGACSETARVPASGAV
jgi:hypothetical protein